MPGAHPARNASALRALIHRHRRDILAEWRRSARSIPPARDLGSVALVDHVPEVIDEIADVADAALAAGGAHVRFETARRHALDRIADGFDVSAVVHELSILRDAILAVWERESAHAPLADVRALDLAIDQAIHATVARYAETHHRTLAAIDRITTASVEATDRDELLQRLLDVFKQTAPAVDTAAILLVEGDRIRNCATVGLEDEVRQQFSLRIGEGFSGTIAAQRRPLELREAHADPLVRSEVIRRLRIRALYGVPMIHDGEVIGVAHMGSLHAHEFTSEDRQLFDSLAARATVAIVNFTLRHERERALAKLESLLAASPVGIGFLDPDLRFLRINQALAAFSGFAAADHIGKTVDAVDPAASARAIPILQEVLATGEPVVNLQFDIVRPVTGEPATVLASFFPVRRPSGGVSGVGIVAVDVTDQRRTQEALHREQARLQAIIDHAPAAIWVKDPDGRIVIANRRLASSLSTPFETVVGKRSSDILPAEIARQHEEADAVVLAENRAVEVEEIAPAPDGVRTFLSIKFPLPGDPPLVGGIATDITERKRMERELEAAVQMREELLSVVSHDLRNPLSTVQLSATVLTSHLAGDVRARRHLEMIARACGRMETLIDDLLDMALIRAGRFTLALATVPVDPIADEVIDLEQLRADEKRISIVQDYAEVRGVPVACDRDRILQVFGNLIGNAIKFCPPDGEIGVSGRLDGDCIRFTVEDNGPGIAAAVLPRLFEPYWSGAETSRKGTGLGLYIVRGIVESHGGRVWVDSAPGAGARFSFTLPRARE